MPEKLKTQQQILSKLNIKALNPMQEEALEVILNHDDTILLSPTGSGKTLAFLLPLIELIDIDLKQVQALILAPSRELAIQIEQVLKNIGSGIKCNVFYGGRNFSKDKSELNSPPQILIGTPGRIADHFRRESFALNHIKYLILDEFDKSLEIGFEDDMEEICEELDQLEKKILTSATHNVQIPSFVGIIRPKTMDYLDSQKGELVIKRVLSPEKDKLQILGKLLRHIGNRSGIVFCNFKDSIQRVSEHLRSEKIPHGTFYGGMEQKERERALIKFRNGTHKILLATDLAARGIDVEGLDFIIHYHLPLHETEFTHRNGRTARMNRGGTAYVIHWEQENLPEFIIEYEVEELTNSNKVTGSAWTTLFVSGGRKDKISKGDIAGLCLKQGKIKHGELGIIELKPDCAFVAVHANKVFNLIKLIDNSRLKKKKIRVRII